MPAEENKASTRRWFEQVNKGNMDIVDELMAANLVHHDPNNPEVVSRQDYKQWIGAFWAAFPDGHLTLEDVIAEGDKLVNSWTYRGTHTGDLPTLPATGKQVEFTGTYILHFAGGKVVESWAYVDNLSMLQQLGVIPPMGGGG